MKSLSKKGELLESGKEDSYERLRLQARVEAQSPKAALGAETTQERCLKVNCRIAAREGGLGYSFEIQVFQNFLSAEKGRFGVLFLSEFVGCLFRKFTYAT